MDLREEGQLLYVSSVDVSRANGPGVNEREFLVSLCEFFGSRVHIVVPEPETAVPEIPQENTTLTRPHRRFSPVPFLLHHVSQIRAADSLMGQRRFELLVFRLGPLPLAAWRLSRKRKPPFALKTLGTGAFSTLDAGTGILRRFLAPANRVLVKAVVSGAIAVDVCTESYRCYFQEKLSVDPGRIRCIQNATNTDRFFPGDQMEMRRQLGLSRFSPIIGFVGGRPWERGGAQAVSAGARLRGGHRNLGVVVVGGGEGMGALKELAGELGMLDRCVFPGEVRYEEVSRYINCFDVGISLDTKENLAAKGNSSQKVRQYVACGIPVVSAGHGNGFLEVHGLGSLVNVDDGSEIEKEICKWVSLSGEERQAHIEKARDFALRELSMRKALSDRIDLWNESLLMARRSRSG